VRRKMGGGREADGTGADDGNGQLRIGHGTTPQWH
jgi:hypothetical protein